MTDKTTPHVQASCPPVATNHSALEELSRRWMVLAAAPDHHLAAPVSGRYRGTGVGSSLAYLIRLQAASSLEELEGTAQPMVPS